MPDNQLGTALGLGIGTVGGFALYRYIKRRRRTIGPAAVGGTLLSTRLALWGEPYRDDWPISDVFPVGAQIFTVSPGDTIAVEATWRTETTDADGNPIDWPYVLVAGVRKIVPGERLMRMVAYVLSWEPITKFHAPGLYTTQFPPLMLPTDAELRDHYFEVALNGASSDEVGNPIIGRLDQQVSTKPYDWLIRVIP